MDAIRVVYEGGVETVWSREGVWRVAGDPDPVATPGAVMQHYNLRPVLYSDLSDNRERRDFILPAGSGDLLDLQASALYSAHFSGVILPIFALSYDVGATVYHCTQLANAYATACAQLARIMAIPGYPPNEGGISSLGGGDYIYYEFDALMSAARRAYDKLGHVIWGAFAHNGGGRPDNFAQMLARCSGLPPELAERLQRSWDVTGAKLKDYRDCTQHFASADIGLCTLTMSRLSEGVWRALARIPDNPEAKSRKKFTYEMGLDALSYGWEVCSEIVSLASATVGTLPGG